MVKTRKNHFLWILVLWLLIAFLASCASTEAKLEEADYKDPSLPVEERVEDLLGWMTLQEKIGQMVQIANGSVRPGDIAEYNIGAVLSPGGGAPNNNSVDGWAEMVNAFQEEGLSTRLQIPILYGVDAVHGHGNLMGATIFPHQIGLGASRNPELVRKIGQATAKEVLATGITWNYAPVLAAAQDIRWGRTYESFSEDPELVKILGTAYVQGLQSIPADYDAAPGQSIFVLATPKHFIGDGATTWGTSNTDNYMIDQGDMLIEEAEIRKLFLPPYTAAIEAGALSVMPSYSSWNGLKMHASKYWLTNVLKEEINFAGFVISDLNGITQIDEDYYAAVVTGVNAGEDMVMISADFKGLIRVLERAVENGDISEERIDDAVRRILTVKFHLGLFDNPYANPQYANLVGSEEHRLLARQAVSESLVLLRNENGVLPLDKGLERINIGGFKADTVGVQSGGWTITWQGIFADLGTGTTILEAIEQTVSPTTIVEYSSSGIFENYADVCIIAVGESPYAEGQGDSADLSLPQADIEIIENARDWCEHLVVVILSGRPLIITDQFKLADAWIAAWLPGSEGQGVADNLFGDRPFTGKLPFTWPRSNDQLPINMFNSSENEGCEGSLFPYGYGLDTAGTQMIEWLDCP